MTNEDFPASNICLSELHMSFFDTEMERVTVLDSICIHIISVFYRTNTPDSQTRVLS